LVKGYPFQRVVRQSDYDNFHKRPLDFPQKHTDFDLVPEREDFVKNMKGPIPNDERFNLSEKFDRSTYLSTVRRVPMREFDSYSARKSELLILQGGNANDRDCYIPRSRPD